MTDGIITRLHVLVKLWGPQFTPVCCPSACLLWVLYPLFRGQWGERVGVIRASVVIVRPCPET